MKKLYVVGMGPGDYESMTIRADRVLRECDVIVGYTIYVELAEQYYPDKEFLTTAMICSGDAGVYGMAGLILEIGREYPEVSVEVIPGVTAASSGAAVLGAPLMHDFAVISLSDLLTPWETIEKRLQAAAMGDLCVCIYNPSSKKRAGYLRRACEILMEEKSPDTVCGAVKNIGREGEERRIMTLAQLSDYEADMFTTVFVGNSQTMELSGCMVTPRGYRL